MPPRKRPTTLGLAAVSPREQFSQHLAPFLHYLEAECGMSVHTLQAYRSDVQQFLDWLGTFSHGLPVEVDLKLLTEHLQHLHERKLAASSIARHLIAVKMFFRYLVLEGVILESTAELLSSPKLWRHLPQVLSPEAVNRLLAAPCAEDRYRLRDRAILAVLYATGCRVSEVANLSVRDLNLPGRFARCLGKGNKERMVALSPVAVSALESYLTHERPKLVGFRDTDQLFVSRAGLPLSRVILWKLVKKYARRIGASSHVSPHTLRHSFATHMLAGGAEIRALQELLGHASIATTQLYTQVEHSRLKAIHLRCHPRG